MDEFEPRADKENTTSGLTLTDTEQYELLEVLSGPLYQITRICKPVLQRLDEGLSSGGASYDELVSIEHVLPQTVEDDSEWAALFPDEQERSEWTHRVANLVFLTRRINTRASNWDFERKKKEYFSSIDGSSPFVITQGVLRTDSWTPEHLGARQRQLLLKLSQIWRLDAIDVDAKVIEFTKQKHLRQGTDRKIIDAKRDEIMQALSRREKVNLEEKGAHFWNDEKNLRAVCVVSKRNAKRAAPYWYGYSSEGQKFLSQGASSFLIFGCVDRDSAYAMPATEIEKVLGDLHKTSQRHWHIELDENESGGLDLVRRDGSRIPLNKFELKLG
jgi:hypothetical protein